MIPLKLFHELASNFSIQHIIEEIAKQFAVLDEVLEQDLLSYVIGSVHHFHQKV